MSGRYIGDFTKGQTIRLFFNTLSQALVPTTPTVAPTVSIYKNSTTETTVGVTQPSVDYDGKAGLHFLVIDTTDAFYETAMDYAIVLTAGTVDSKDLTRNVLRTFSIENRRTEAIKDDTITIPALLG
jgi:hypothetical protein